MSASEVTIRDQPPRIRSLPTVSRDVGMFQGIAPWGPVNVAQTVIDYDDYVEKYRSFVATGEMAQQVRQAFIGGMRKAIINRIVHVNPSTGVPVTAAKATLTVQTAATAATKGSVTGTEVGPWGLANTDTLIGNVDGVGNQTLTITSAAAALECVNAETYALANGQTLTVKIDGEAVAQTITFLTAEFVAIGAATAEEVVAVINAKIVGASATATTGGTKVTITSDSQGTDSEVEVTGGTANAALGFSIVAVNGTGNVANVSSVTSAELKTLLEAAWTNGGGVTVTDVGGYLNIEANTAGSAGSILVDATSTADDEIGLDNATHAGFDGAAANTLTIEGLYYGGTIGNAITFDITTATNAEAEKFDLIIYVSGIQEEIFRNVTMDATSADYVEDVVNTLAGKSLLVTATDESATGTATQRRPANSTANALAGGDDGLASLDDADFTGDEGLGTGYFAFELVDEGDLLAVPDRPTATTINAGITYCETQRKNTCIFVPDIPAGQTKENAATFVATLTSSELRTGLAWPRVKIPNPDKAVFGVADVITVPSSGSIIGRMAKNTLTYKEDVFKQPGNPVYGRLENVVGVENEDVKKIATRRYLTPYGINPIMEGRGSDNVFAVWLDDVQAGKTTGNWKSIGEIRGVALIRKVVGKYLDEIRTTANTQEARRTDKFNIEAYLAQWLAKEVFASTNAAEAFYVNTDPAGTGINNPLVQEAEQYKVIIGLATARARRFVDLVFTRDQRSVENYVQQQLNAP